MLPPSPKKKNKKNYGWGVARIWEGANTFFSDLEICTSQRDLLRMAKPCALRGGFGGMPPQNFFLNGTIWCVFWSDFVFKIFKKLLFFYIKIKHFRCTLAMGITHGEIIIGTHFTNRGNRWCIFWSNWTNNFKGISWILWYNLSVI